MNTPDTVALAESVDFEILGHGLGRDLKSALDSALAGGVIFETLPDSLAIFRRALANSIRSIDSEPRGVLFKEFLLKGPYQDQGELPPDLVGRRISDEDAAAVIRFIYYYMVNCFKGAIAELLAVEPCLRLVSRLQRTGELVPGVRLYAGETVCVHRKNRAGVLKGADVHFLVVCSEPRSRDVKIAGVAEVKSYFASQRRLRRQMDRQLRRAKQGLRVCGVDYPPASVSMGYGRDTRVLKVAVVPSRWRLSRSFQFEESDLGRFLVPAPFGALPEKDRIDEVGDREWRVTLRWSKEAIAEAAYEMTFWYMGKVGEVIYSRSVPEEWAEMSPSRAGRNAAKMMLYHSILRSRTFLEEQRAIALYNSYAFGYSLGMSFRNRQGQREMLWPEDLHEIELRGETKNGCTLWP